MGINATFAHEVMHLANGIRPCIPSGGGVMYRVMHQAAPPLELYDVSTEKPAPPSPSPLSRPMFPYLYRAPTPSLRRHTTSLQVLPSCLEVWYRRRGHKHKTIGFISCHGFYEHCHKTSSAALRLTALFWQDRATIAAQVMYGATDAVLLAPPPPLTRPKVWGLYKGPSHDICLSRIPSSS